MRVSIGIRVPKTELLEKVESAEEAIKKLCSVMKELELFEHGMPERLNVEEIESNSSEETTYFYLSKSIDVDAIKEPLAAVKALMQPLREAVKGLDKAIITEMTKEKPRE